MADGTSEKRAKAYPDIDIAGQERFVTVGGGLVPLRTFLEYCLSGKRAVLSPFLGDMDPAVFRDHFLAAGTTELERLSQNNGWTQLNLSLAGDPKVELYAKIADLFCEALGRGEADNAFFMHKPPGLRLRLQSTTAATGTCAKRLHDAAGIWKQANLAVDFWREPYEPETTLFGGPESMDFIHRLFTADSVFWLRHHSGRPRHLHSLLVSLLLLRSFFAAFGIVEWEDLDVWEKVRSRTGRSISDKSALENHALDEVGAELIRFWRNTSGALHLLDEERRRIDVLTEQFRRICPAWRERCFRSGQPALGPRSAAALYVIFFWNRAGVSLERQIIAAEALAGRKTVE